MFEITYVKAGKSGEVVVHDYRPTTKAEAFGVGHELTRDGVADFFRVTRVVVAESACAFNCSGAELVADPDRWGDSWSRCTVCGCN